MWRWALGDRPISVEFSASGKPTGTISMATGSHVAGPLTLDGRPPQLELFARNFVSPENINRGTRPGRSVLLQGFNILN
jgi:hypothetical protein